MTECEYADRLNAYYDGELSAAQRAKVEAHVDTCPACAAELDRLRKLGSLLGNLPRPAISEAALARLHRAADLWPTASIRRMASALAAIAALVLVTCLVALWRQDTAAQARPAQPWELAAEGRRTMLDAAPPAAEEQLASLVVQDLSSREDQ